MRGSVDRLAMNESFLLPLAAYMQGVHQNAHPAESSMQPSSPQLSPCLAPVEQLCGTIKTSETCVVPIGALLDVCQQQTALHTQLSLQSSVMDGAAAVNCLARPPTASTYLDSSCPDGVPAESLSSTLNTSRECRICLSAGNTGDLVRPCSCCGSMSYTHTACLSAWVQERGSLVCELCGQPYKEPHAQQLEPLVKAAMQRRKLAAFPAAEATGSSSSRCRMTRDEWICLL
jgi:hypothetical protein